MALGKMKILVETIEEATQFSPPSELLPGLVRGKGLGHLLDCLHQCFRLSICMAAILGVDGFSNINKAISTCKVL